MPVKPFKLISTDTGYQQFLTELSSMKDYLSPDSREIPKQQLNEILKKYYSHYRKSEMDTIHVYIWNHKNRFYQDILRTENGELVQCPINQETEDLMDRYATVIALMMHKEKASFEVIYDNRKSEIAKNVHTSYMKQKQMLKSKYFLRKWKDDIKIWAEAKCEEMYRINDDISQSTNDIIIPT